MNPITYTLSSCLENAKKYSCKKEWRDKDKNFYHNAWKKGWFDICTEHMTNPYSSPTDEECILSAKLYKHKIDWTRGHSREYSKAKKNPILYEACTKHMLKKGNLRQRLVYMFYLHKTCYIGITCNLEKRMERHEQTLRYKDLCKFGKVEVKILHDFCDVEYCTELERMYIEEFKKKGWIILNKTNGGELGGRIGKTKDDILKQASKFHSVKAWRTCKKSLYSRVSCLGILNECTSHMIKLVHKWSIAEIKAIALKYTTKKEWRENEPKSYDVALKKKIMDECSSHMIKFRNINGHWNTYENCLAEALKYKTTREWKSFGKGSYFAACKNNWWKLISNAIKQQREQITNTLQV